MTPARKGYRSSRSSRLKYPWHSLPEDHQYLPGLLLLHMTVTYSAIVNDLQMMDLTASGEHSHSSHTCTVILNKVAASSINSTLIWGNIPKGSELEINRYLKPNCLTSKIKQLLLRQECIRPPGTRVFPQQGREGHAVVKIPPPHSVSLHHHYPEVYPPP